MIVAAQLVVTKWDGLGLGRIFRNAATLILSAVHTMRYIHVPPEMLPLTQFCLLSASWHGTWKHLLATQGKGNDYLSVYLITESNRKWEESNVSWLTPPFPPLSLFPFFLFLLLYLCLSLDFNSTILLSASLTLPSYSSSHSHFYQYLVNIFIYVFHMPQCIPCILHCAVACLSHNAMQWKHILH